MIMITPDKDNIKVGNTLIFRCDEYRDGNITEYDGHVILVGDKGADLIYLSGYKSRNDFIPWKDIIAKVDKRKQWITLQGEAPYSGNFIEFWSNK